MPTLQLVQDQAADALLASNPLALLIGMLLDQQVTMESAFAGPKKIADRIGGVDAVQIAQYDPDKFAAMCAETPAVHRFPGSMGKRVQALAQVVVDEYEGDAAAIWSNGDPDGREVLARLKRLPGFGDQKARIFLALLGKQYGFTGGGWREAAGDYGKTGTFMSVADVRDGASLDKVRSYKKQAKAAAREANAAKA
ncbi:MAG: HhH-GPD-type base excision DNA repair protein [Mycobacterium sp.]